MINAKSVITILRRSMNLMDEHLEEHGARVAYLLYHMFKQEKKYSKEELDNFFIIGLLHDIGAYKTDEIDSMLTFDCKAVWSHSIYGFLYLKYLSPLAKYSDAILYHHLSYTFFADLDTPNRKLAMYLNLADRIDIYLVHNNNFNKEVFEKQRKKQFSGIGLDLFYAADGTYNLIEKLKNNTYKIELEEIIDSFSFCEETCRGYLRLLCYSTDFRRDETIFRTANTNFFSTSLCRQLNLGKHAEDLIYYATILYDVGMLAIPRNIIDSELLLTDSERFLVEQHIPITLNTLKDTIPSEMLTIIEHHHERLNGSGYPNHLDSSNLSTLDRILQISDVVGSLSCSNARREAFDVEEIIHILSVEAMQGTLDRDLVRVAIRDKEVLFSHATELHIRAFKNYNAIKDQFSTILKQFDKFNH